MDQSLLSDKVLLRSFEEKDTDAIFSYRSMADVARFQYWEPYTRDQTVTFIRQYANADLNKRGEWIGLAIINRNSNELIGDCAVKFNQNKVEIGCNISPLHQNKGFAKDVLNLLFSYCFMIINIDEIYGITDSENIASIKLMKSLQMVKVPNFEEQVTCKGAVCIEHKYSIIKSDYNTK